MISSYKMMTEASFTLLPNGTPGGAIVISPGERLWLLAVRASLAGPTMITWKNVVITVDAGDEFTVDGSSIPNCGAMAAESLQIAGAQRAVVIVGPAAIESVAIAAVARAVPQELRSLMSDAFRHLQQ